MELFWSIFLVFRLNIESYSVNFHLLSKYVKIWIFSRSFFYSLYFSRSFFYSSMWPIAELSLRATLLIAARGFVKSTCSKIEYLYSLVNNFLEIRSSERFLFLIFGNYLKTNSLEHLLAVADYIFPAILLFSCHWNFLDAKFFQNRVINLMKFVNLLLFCFHDIPAQALDLAKT